MRDEEYIYYQDVREKKVTGYSARKKRSHCGKAGCKLPSDYLSKKEIQNMSGECKSYRLNEPMSYIEFKGMPDDLQAVYLTAIREKYNVSDATLAKMFGCSQATLSVYLRNKGLNRRGKFSGKEAWDKEGFWAWVSGNPKTEVQEETQEVADVPVAEEPEVTNEESVTEEMPCETALAPCEEEAAKEEETEIRVKKCVPTTGSMTYEGLAFDILSSLADLLGNANVVLSVKWDVVGD